jgi:predicted RNA-binding protein associated with RNAse of E/G family
MDNTTGDPVSIHKLNEEGSEVWRYEGIVLSKTDSSLTLQAFFDRDDLEFEGLLLKRGDRFIETFYSDRWYNTFEIHDVEDGRLKGWYCNICRPARIENGHIYAEDLALDLIVYPDGRWRILDDDEFAALEISAEDQKYAKGALDQLIDLARQRIAPFKALED